MADYLVKMQTVVQETVGNGATRTIAYQHTIPAYSLEDANHLVETLNGLSIPSGDVLITRSCIACVRVNNFGHSLTVPVNDIALTIETLRATERDVNRDTRR